MPLTREVLSKYVSPVFFETGTSEGEAVSLALDCGFKRVYTVECNLVKFDSCRKKFKKFPQVTLFFGDSGKCAAEMLSSFTGPATFWLDSHFSYSPLDPKPTADTCPILSEIRAIASHPDHGEHTIMVDDFRYFRKGGIPQWNMVDEAAIMSAIEEVFGEAFSYTFEDGFEKDDILVAKKRF